MSLLISFTADATTGYFDDNYGATLEVDRQCPYGTNFYFYSFM